MLINDLHSQKHTFIGFVYSVALHALLILLYVGWTWVASQSEGTIHVYKHFCIIDIAPPPSLSHDIPTSASFATQSDILKPKFGIPVPIPDIHAPEQTMPENIVPIFGDPNSNSNNVIGTPEGRVTTPPEIKPIVTDKPDRNTFVAVDEDPRPVQDIQTLVQYPEQAKRSNLEGKVSYSALIGVDGLVKEVLIDKCDYDVFRPPVIDALMKARFTPARVDQMPVAVYYSGTIIFKLNR